MLRIAAKRSQLAASHCADRLGEIELSPGKVLRVVAGVAVKQHPGEAQDGQEQKQFEKPEQAHGTRTHGVTLGCPRVG